MQSAVMSYMAITDVQSKLAAQSGDVVYYREPSYGTFQTNAKPNGLLGTVSNIEMIGLLMDMDSMKFNTECKDNCLEQWRDYNQQMGAAYSAYEHLIPEQLFSTEEEPVEGISAVKALAIASQQGQRIYTFTEDNLVYLSDLTVDQGTKDEIQAQVQAGMVATVHQHPITYTGWTGVGYTIVHPETGAGSYKISGGSNGGSVVIQAAGYMAIGLGTVNGGLGAFSEVLQISKFVSFARVIGRFISGVGALVSIISALEACSEVPIAAVPAIGFMVGMMGLMAVLLASAVFLGPILIFIIQSVFSSLLSSAVTALAAYTCKDA